MLRTINRGPEQHIRNTKELNFTKRRGAASQEEDILKADIYKFIQVISAMLAGWEGVKARNRPIACRLY